MIRINKGNIIKRIVDNKSKLTVGKNYKVEYLDKNQPLDVFVKNDNGIIQKYLKEYFEKVN